MEGNLSPNQIGDWDFWTHGLDRAFFNRVYSRSTFIGGVLTLLSLGFDQKPLALGLLGGLVMGLFSTWTVEMMVRLLFNGGKYSGVKLAIGAAIKLPFLLFGLVGIAWAGDRHILNVFGVVAGMLVIHGTMLVMVIVTAAAAQDRNRERYR